VHSERGIRAFLGVSSCGAVVMGVSVKGGEDGRRVVVVVVVAAVA
jgi:hypothetical protein